MKIEWGTYRSLLGHGPDFDNGCFRCHDGNHKTESGEEISSDCNTCHTILAEEEKDPAIRITSYNVCYTKLLRTGAIQYTDTASA